MTYLDRGLVSDLSVSQDDGPPLRRTVSVQTRELLESFPHGR